MHVFQNVVGDRGDRGEIQFSYISLYEFATGNWYKIWIFWWRSWICAYYKNFFKLFWSFYMIIHNVLQAWYLHYLICVSSTESPSIIICCVSLTRQLKYMKNGIKEYIRIYAVHNTRGPEYTSQFSAFNSSFFISSLK